MGLRQRVEPWRVMLDRFLYSSPDRTRTAPHIRDAGNVQRLLNNFVIASLPCWVIGLWSLGRQANMVLAQSNAVELAGWRGWLLSSSGIGFDPESMLACFLFGLLFFTPIFLVSLLVGSFWDAIFATVRRRPIDEGLLATSWFYAMILPATAPLYQVALGMSFGWVFGKAIYGGSGRYLVNPALLGLTFLLFAYPKLLFGEGAWVPVPGFNQSPPLELAAAGGIDAVLAAGYTWWDLFLGLRPGPIGTTSVIGCLLGAAFLIYTGAASWRIMLGALLGMIGTVLLFNGLAGNGNLVFEIPWAWHLVLGGFACGAVFFATDPVPAAMTDPGRWVFGILVGLITIVIRVSNPSYNEGVLFAILLASIFSPVIDYVVIEIHIRRRRSGRVRR